MKKAFLRWIRIYQTYISPLFPPTCRYYPTCSTYAIEALKEWGIVIGVGLSIWRILRCQPFGKGGYDPVPRRNRPSASDSDS